MLHELPLLNGQLPYLSCRTRVYDPVDVKQCFEERHRSGLSTRLTFVGDSIVRYQLESLMYFLKLHDAHIQTPEVCSRVLSVALKFILK